MAKISAKHSYHSELIKLRRALDAYREELASLDTKYDEKIEGQLNSFINKGNNKLKKLAFQACDKEQYAQSVLEEKLQKYDIKSYMKQREINHGAAKSIFKLAKENKPFGYVIVERDKKMLELNKKREAFISKLEKEKASFLKKALTTYVVPYRVRREELENEYYALEEKLK